MEIKGRVKAVNGPVERMKKDQSASYTLSEVDVQIGVYNRTKADYATNTFNTVQEPEMVRKAYFGDEARGINQTLQVGDVVTVRMHHYIDQWGHTAAVIDSLTPCNAKAQALEQKPAPAPAAPQQGDDLPF